MTLVMPQFLERFPQVSSTYSGGGFYKGLMTGMIELGALIGTYSSSNPTLADLCRCLEPGLDRRQNL